MEGRLLVRPGAIALLADCRGGTGLHLVRELLESIGVQILTEEKHELTDKHSLPRYALAKASTYGICGCGSSGPAPTFVGAHFSNIGAASRYGRIWKNWRR
jgi:CDGSH-type Zn-finger protein